jgi:DNA helicase-2/ATP-dependent DNA helicase PcrA
MARTFSMKARRLGADIDFKAELNPEQYAAVTAPGGPMLIIAGAGSGKTRALTYRLAWLMHNGVDPQRLMLVTFTNRAAREMLNRVETLVQLQTRQLWGGTFHHIANRLLRRYATAAGVSPDFTILDREDARDLVGACVTEVGINTTERRFPQKRVLLSISSFVQNTLDPLETVLEKRYPMFMREYDGIARVLARYTERKKALQFLDYDDLLAYWLALLKNNDSVRNELAETFLHVLVDEYQDTNALQGEIVDLLASKHRNVCVVGDDSQSIYSFRGANFANILNFQQRYPDTHVYRIETNYRSTPEILALANASIHNNTARLDKVLTAVRPSGLKPTVVVVHDHFVQSRFLAEYVLHLVDEGRKLNDIAILYRSHWHSLEIQLEFNKRNIPYEVRGGLRFFEQAHIKDSLAFLRVVQNPRDELAWLRVLPLMPRVAGKLSQRLWAHISATDDPLAEALKPDSAEVFPAAVRPFYKELRELLQCLKDLPAPADMIDAVLKSFYGDYIDTHYEGAALRKEDIRGLANFSAQYKTIEAFLADASLAGEFQGETCVTGPEEMEFTILSTVHQAKGLEWPIVMIPWLADGRFPTDMAINTKEEEEEERRVFHVATTRAKDELYLVVPQIFSQRGGRRVMMKPSRFLSELPADITEPMIIDEGLPGVTTGEV